MAKFAHLGAVFICGCVLMSLGQVVQAEVGLTIRGVIVAPPSCVINGGSTLNVPFGHDLMTTRIDGVNYKRGVPYTVTCTGHSSDDMTLKLQGTGASFDTTSLSTNNPDLGIRLFINDSVWPLNTLKNFTFPTLPTMQAVPVKNPGSSLTAGAFSASATLVVAQQ